MTMKRRLFLRGTLAAGAAVTAGMLVPRAVLAAWPTEAFAAKNVTDTINSLYGSDATAASSDIKIKAPAIAENGAVVPITVTSGISGVTSIAIIASNNPLPLAGRFELGKGALADVSTRVKMGKSGDIIAVVKAGGKLHSARKGVKVTIGGCGG